MGSIYDPIGYLAPFTPKGKQILQQMCRDKLDWDDPVPDELRAQWDNWRQGIFHVRKLNIKRCFKPQNFGLVKLTELHHFSDASLDGYGQCSYVRLVNEGNEVHVSLVIGKARVTPLKQMTIPRLELMAATVSARMGKFLRELSYREIFWTEHFWTDSKIVLGYINNDAKRFHTFVANRVQEIRDATDPLSWLYVESNENPADDASRGLEAKDLVNGSRWINGPNFLWESTIVEPQENKMLFSDAGPEVKKAVVNKVYGRSLNSNMWDIDRLNHISTWHRARKIIALCLQWKLKLRNRGVKWSSLAKNSLPLQRLTVSLSVLQQSEKEILKAVQYKHLNNEIQVLKHLKVNEANVVRNAARQRNGQIKKSTLPVRSFFRW